MIVPLWALYLDITPAIIGVILGVRHLPGLLFAIHGGILFDRLGTRPVMIVFAGIAVLVPLLFPILPWVWAIIVLQMIWGFATTMTWMGAQTSVSQFMRGSTRYAARLSVAVRLGMIVGPPVAGLAWDFWGPWGGFSAISFWALGLLVSCYFIPSHNIGSNRVVRRFRASDLIPRSSDYVEVLRMMTIPAIAICVYLSATRIASYGIQESFYIIYLENLGLSKANIGLLAGTGHSILGAFGALLLSLSPTVRSTRTELYIFLGTLVLAVILISVTPLMTHFWPLFAAISVRGLLLGFNQPMMISTMARVAPHDAQGTIVGLRTTANRAASTLIPIFMGFLVEVIGLEASFYVIGIMMLAACIVIWVLMLRALSRGDIPD